MFAPLPRGNFKTGETFNSIGGRRNRQVPTHLLVGKPWQHKALRHGIILEIGASM
jgi:hypothetical protein